VVEVLAEVILGPEFGVQDDDGLDAGRQLRRPEGPAVSVNVVNPAYDLVHGLEQQKLAVLSGHWPLFRYNPDAAPGLANFVLDSRAPSIPLEQYIYNETRYTMLRQSNPEEAKILLAEAEQDVADRWKRYEALAQEFSAVAAVEAVTATAAKGVQ